MKCFEPPPPKLLRVIVIVAAAGLGFDFCLAMSSGIREAAIYRGVIWASLFFFRRMRWTFFIVFVLY